MGDKIFFAALLSVLVQVSGWSETYRAAVVEYHPAFGLSEQLNMLKNLENYNDFIKKAKAKGAEIIVFPEGGLFTTEPSPIPDPSEHIVPCDSKDFVTTEVVKNISCASKKSSIYTVVNLSEKRACEPDHTNCPPSGYYIYNTNVVFNRGGMVIARYAKYNLFDENFVNRTPDPEIVFFDTDFNVRFGTFICFDILFSAPAQRLVEQYQIKDFVFSTFWFSELPFLTALQVQRGWAETNNVNLLASGVNYPSKGSGGSGIYNGKYGHIVEVMPEKGTSKLLIADIPKIQSYGYSNIDKREAPKSPNYIQYYYNSTNEAPKVKDAADSDLILLKDQIYLYSSEIINPGKIFEQTVCSRNDFCCDFHVNMDALKKESQNYTYRAVAFNGVRRFGVTFRGGVQSCGVVLCDGPNILNCTSRVKNIPELFKFNAIRITGSFNLKNAFQIPSTLTDGKELKPLPANKYEFIKKRKELKSEVSLELLWPVYDLHTFAIWGRDFTRDMEPEVPTAGTSSLLPFPLTFATIVGYVLLLR